MGIYNKRLTLFSHTVKCNQIFMREERKTMHHCHPCFGGHKPTGPICTTAPVIHPTKQCVTHSFQQRWCHTFSRRIQHMYIINKLKPKLLPANKFKCKCCGPNRPRIRRMWTMWPWSSSPPRSSNIPIRTRTECITVGPGPNVSPFYQTMYHQ